jgi:hypothetical protein
MWSPDDLTCPPFSAADCPRRPIPEQEMNPWEKISCELY